MQRYNSKAFELETSQKRAKTNDNNYNIDDTKKVVFAKGGKQRVKPCPGWRVFWHTSTHCNIVLLYWKIAKLSSKGKTVFKFLKWGTWGSRAKVAIYQHSNLHQAWASPSPFCHMYLINIQINKGRIIYNNNLTFLVDKVCRGCLAPAGKVFDAHHKIYGESCSKSGTQTTLHSSSRSSRVIVSSSAICLLMKWITHSSRSGSSHCLAKSRRHRAEANTQSLVMRPSS